MKLDNFLLFVIILILVINFWPSYPIEFYNFLHDWFFHLLDAGASDYFWDKI